MPRASFAIAAVALLGAPLFAEYKPSPEIAQGLDALRQSQYVKTREIADRVLKSHPDSFEAWYLLGAVYINGDTNLPRARYCLTRARGLIERRWTPPISADGPADFHRWTMSQLVRLAGLSEEREWQVQLIREYGRYYKDGLRHRIGWPLMKLGRFDEARREMLALVDSKDEDVATDAINTLGAIASELDRREESYEWFTRLVNEVERNKWRMGIEFLTNRASAALGLLRFDEAERELLRAARVGKHSAANPWTDLALLYAGSGRLAEAISAVKNMHVWSSGMDPVLWEQKWNQHQQATATVLLAAGYDEAALSILRRILDRPDRLGTTSVHAHEAEIGLLHLYYETLKARRERVREEMSWSSTADWARKGLERLSIEREMWSARSRAAALIMQHRQLAWTMIPFGPNTTSVEWARPSLREVVGTGLWETELKKLMARTGAEADRERPYLLAAMGESKWTRGRNREAIADLKGAEAGLPAEEVLLRARVNAVIGSAYQKLGDSAAATERYRRALDSDPRVFRMLDIAVPVTVVAAGDAESNQAASMLRGSPRFTQGGGFTIRVARSGQNLTARLQAADGTVFSAAAAPAKDVPAFAREFHRRGSA